VNTTAARANQTSTKRAVREDCGGVPPGLQAQLSHASGALQVLERGTSFAEAADHFGVSLQLFSWRANQTGVVRQLHYRRLHVVA
jgi:hypothetical protein